MPTKSQIEKLPRPDFPRFLMKNFDPLCHKDRDGLIYLVKTEIDLYWEGQAESAITNEDRHKTANAFLWKLRLEK